VSSKRYPEEFKIEAVKQVSDHRHAVAEIPSGVLEYGINVTHLTLVLAAFR
jgi:transposase-like protein